MDIGDARKGLELNQNLRGNAAPVSPRGEFAVLRGGNQLPVTELPHVDEGALAWSRSIALRKA